MYKKTIAMAAADPITPPMMAATFAVTVPDEAAAPVETGVVGVGAPAVVACEANGLEVDVEVVVAKMVDDVNTEKNEDTIVPDSTTCVEVLLVENKVPTLVGRVVKVENTEGVVDVVEVTELTDVLDVVEVTDVTEVLV